MNISMNTDYSFAEPVRMNRAQSSSGFDDCIRDVRKEQDEEQAEKAGGWLPGGTSQEDRQQIEMLKNEAMQIAVQAKDGLTSVQEEQIKDIERKIGKISDMPVSENLSGKAKQVAEQTKLEENIKAELEVQMQKGALQDGVAGSSEFQNAGMGMLKQNALVTAIKGMGATSTASMGMLA